MYIQSVYVSEMRKDRWEGGESCRDHSAGQGMSHRGLFGPSQQPLSPKREIHQKNHFSLISNFLPPRRRQQP